MFGMNRYVFMNGKTIKVTGNNIVIQNGQIIIDGQIYGVVDPGYTVLVDGYVENLQCDCSVSVKGDCYNVKCGGSCDIDGNVANSVNAGGSVDCEKVGGEIHCGGSVCIG